MTKRKGGAQPVPLPTDVLRRLEEEGAVEDGMTKSEARFHAAMCRCLGVKPGALSDDSRKFLKAFDAHMREIAKANDIELHDDD